MKDDACQSARRVGVTEGGTLSEGCTGISWDESPLGVDFEKPSQDVHKGRSVLGSCCGDFRDRRPESRASPGLLEAGSCRVGFGDKLEVTVQKNDSGWCPGREART